MPRPLLRGLLLALLFLAVRLPATDAEDASGPAAAEEKEALVRKALQGSPLDLSAEEGYALEAIEIRRRAGGAEHAALGKPLLLLGLVRERQARIRRAERGPDGRPMRLDLLPVHSLLRRALALLEKAPTEHAEEINECLGSLAALLFDLPAPRQAARALLRALGALPDAELRYAREATNDAIRLGTPGAFLDLTPGLSLDGAARFEFGAEANLRAPAADRACRRAEAGAGRSHGGDVRWAELRAIVGALRTEDPATAAQGAALLEEVIATVESRWSGPRASADSNRVLAEANAWLGRCRYANGDLEGALACATKAETPTLAGFAPQTGFWREGLEAALRRDGEAIRQALAVAARPEAAAGAADLAERDRVVEALCLHEDGWRVPTPLLAERLAQDGIGIRRRLYGAEAPQVADGHASLGLVRAAAGRFQDAEASWRECLRLRQKTLAPDAPEIPEAQAALAVCLCAQGRFQDALEPASAALAAVEPRGATPETYRGLANLASIALAAGVPATADAAVTRSLAAHRKGNSPATLPHGDAMVALAGACRELGRVEDERFLASAASGDYRMRENPRPSALVRLEGDLEGAVAIERQALRRGAGGSLPPGVLADRRLDLGTALLDAGHLDEGYAYLAEAARLLEGPDYRISHPDRSVTDVLLGVHAGMARALAHRGSLAEALPYAESAFRLHVGYEEVAAAPAGPTLSVPLQRLYLGDLLRAVLPPSSPEGTEAVTTYARLMAAGGDPVQAIGMLEEARDGTSAAVPSGHLRRALLQAALAEVRLLAGDPAGASDDARGALSLLEKAFGGTHPALADVLATWGDAATLLGRLEEARTAYDRVLELAEDTLPAQHLAVARAWNGRARCALKAGRPAEAVDPMRRAVAALAERVRDNFPGSTLSERLDLVASAHWALANWIEVAAAAGIHGYDEALRLRGLASAEVATRGPPPAPGKAAEKALEALRAAERRLARLSHEAPTRGWRRVPWRREVADTAALVARLRGTLDSGAGKAERPSQVAGTTGRAIAERIPPHHVLVDTCLAGGRYTAWILGRRRDPLRLDLGEAMEIERTCDAFRAAVQAAPSSDDGGFLEAGAAVRRLVWDPIAAHLPADTKGVLWFGDGALGAVPWTACPLEGKAREFLGDRHLWIALPYATALLRPAATSRISQATVLVGDLDYESARGGDQPVITGEPRLVDRVPGLRRFAPLPGTKAEIAGLAERFAKARGRPPATVLMGDGVRESTLRSAIRDARVLHLATHAFVRESLGTTLRVPAGEEFRLGPGLERHVQGMDPLLLSGLALSGANARTQEGDDDGILTALEVAQLDAAGAELVFLAACESASGVLRSGEGRMGLVQAFAAAGARQVVASLWAVSDESTRDLSLAFYDRFLGTKPASAAVCLREACRALRSDPRTAAPRHWAAFVAYGLPP